MNTQDHYNEWLKRVYAPLSIDNINIHRFGEAHFYHSHSNLFDVYLVTGLLENVKGFRAIEIQLQKQFSDTNCKYYFIIFFRKDETSIVPNTTNMVLAPLRKIASYIPNHITNRNITHKRATDAEILQTQNGLFSRIDQVSLPLLSSSDPICLFNGMKIGERYVIYFNSAMRTKLFFQIV